MLNEEYKKQAVYDLQEVEGQYRNAFRKTLLEMESLHSSRTLAVKTIQHVEQYIVIIANRPREYDTRIDKIRVQYIEFLDAMNTIIDLESKNQIQQGMPVGIFGLGISAIVSMNMALGTTSASAALSSLSALSNTVVKSSLASVGTGLGGTIFAGTVIPVGGLILGGISLAGNLIELSKTNKSNVEIARKAEESTITVKKEIERLKELSVKVRSLAIRTDQLSRAISRLLLRLRSSQKEDYRTFQDEDLNDIASLFNTTEILSNKIRETVSGR